MSRHSLRSLSDQQILSRIETLTRRERAITLLVLLHLNEIERRRLHLKLGYASLFDYCTSKLGYSASAAVRRIRSARCTVRFPMAYEMLKNNELTVSTLSQVSRALTAANHEELLVRIRGKSQREVEAILAEYQPSPMPPDRVRTVVVRVPLPSNEARNANAVAAATPAREAAEHAVVLTSSSKACEKSAYNRNGCDADAPVANSSDGATFERRAVIQFSASEAFMAKLEKVRSLAWHRLPANASLEQVFELALDIMIEKNDPSRRAARRERAAARRRKNDTRGERRSNAKTTTTVTDARYIAAATKDNVHVRDDGRCTFTSGERRCASTRALQFDHVKPVALGGKGTHENLRLLCAYHNRLEAERLLGSTVARNGP